MSRIAASAGDVISPLVFSMSLQILVIESFVTSGIVYPLNYVGLLVEAPTLD